jgi:hypothetical protein
MKIALSLPGLLLAAWAIPAACVAGDVVDSSDVLVPGGPFGTMRRVDSETLILPNADAVIRAQQQRTAREESRERAAAREEAAAPTVAITVPATEPEFGLPPAASMAPSSDAIPQTTTFEFPVDGEMTEFTRWGSGDKLIVLFNHTGVTISSGPDGKIRSMVDSMRRDIEGNLPAYAPLFAAGYSLVVWSYPHTPRLSREVGDLEKKPDLSGIASSVVEGIRKETGATEMVLVGNSMGGGVLLWDLDKISSMGGVRTLLISPTEYFMPSIDRLGDGLPNTVLIAIQPDRHLKSPEIKAWAAKHASRPEGLLEGDFDEFFNHLLIGHPGLTHEKLVSLIQQAAQPTDSGGLETTPTRQAGQ